jgi:hypothetical protein
VVCDHHLLDRIGNFLAEDNKKTARTGEIVYIICVFDSFLSSFRKLYSFHFLLARFISIRNMEDVLLPTLKGLKFFSDGKNLSGRKIEWNYNNKERS